MRHLVMKVRIVIAMSLILGLTGCGFKAPIETTSAVTVETYNNGLYSEEAE